MTGLRVATYVATTLVDSIEPTFLHVCLKPFSVAKQSWALQLQLLNLDPTHLCPIW